MGDTYLMLSMVLRVPLQEHIIMRAISHIHDKAFGKWECYKLSKMSDEIILVVNPDGSILGRRPFNGGTIALQRLQFSSNLGTAFCISAERVPQVIIYDDEESKCD